MVEIGSVGLSGCQYILGYDLLSQNKSANTSTVRLYGLLRVTNSYVSWSSGSASVHTSGLQPIGTYYTRGDHIVITRDFTFGHDGNGNFSAYIGASLSTTFVSGSCGGTLTLPHINRYAVLNSGSNFTDKTNPVYNITAYGTYPLRVKIEAGGNPQLITRDLSTRNSTTYTLVLTNEERNKLKTIAGNAKTLAVRETVCCMSGNTELSFSAKDYTLTFTEKKTKIRVNGEYKDSTPYVRINGEWKQATPYIRINGEWKETI